MVDWAGGHAGLLSSVASGASTLTAARWALPSATCGDDVGLSRGDYMDYYLGKIFSVIVST